MRKAFMVDEDGDVKDFRDGELYETMVQIVRKYIQRQKNGRVRMLDIVRTYPEVRDHIESILSTLSAADEIVIDRSNVSFVFVELMTPQERERRHVLRSQFIADVARLPPSRLGGFQ